MICLVTSARRHKKKQKKSLHYNNPTTLLHFHWVFSTLSSSNPFVCDVSMTIFSLPLNHDRHHAPQARLRDPAKSSEKTVIFSKEQKRNIKSGHKRITCSKGFLFLHQGLAYFCCIQRFLCFMLDARNQDLFNQGWQNLVMLRFM